MNYKVIHEPIDFFDNTHLGDVIISNPPFADPEHLLTTLKETGKPFIIIMPEDKKERKYYQKLFPFPDAPMVTLSHKLLTRAKFKQANIVMDNIKDTTPAGMLFYCYRFTCSL